MLRKPAQARRLEQWAVRIRGLREKVSRLSTELAELKDAAPATIVLRELRQEEGAAEIRQLFQSGQTLYYSDIAHQLGTALPTVVEICQELLAEGEIEVDADAI